MNNEVKAKKHMLCEKAPFLAMILGCLIALVPDRFSGYRYTQCVGREFIRWADHFMHSSGSLFDRI